MSETLTPHTTKDAWGQAILRTPLPIGKKTRWGKIAAVGTTGGERYYWMTDKGNKTKCDCVSMIPAVDVERGDVECLTEHRWIRSNGASKFNPKGAPVPEVK